MAKGGTESKEVTLPKFFETAIQQGWNGDGCSQVGTKYSWLRCGSILTNAKCGISKHPTAAGAFGMNTGAGNYMPEAVEAGGAMGYSSAPVYDQAMQKFKKQRQHNMIILPAGIDPVTGQVGSRAARNQPVALECKVLDRKESNMAGANPAMVQGGPVQWI